MSFLFIDFLNSEWRDGLHDDSLVDRMDQPKWFENVLADWNIKVEESLKQKEMKELKRLRSFLRRLVVEFIKGEPLQKEDINLLNAYLHNMPVYQVFSKNQERYELEYLPIKHDWNWVQMKIVHSFTEMMTKSDPKRLKICENQKCGWFFYDASRNRSRRWCYHSNCGNLMNVRRYRARQKKNKQ